MYVPCIVCYQPAHLCNPHYVLPPIMVCVVALYNQSTHLWSIILLFIATVNPTRKEIESLGVSLPFKYFSCCNLRDLIVFIIFIEVDEFSINLGNKTLISPLKRGVVGLGNTAPISTNPICNNARLTLLLLPKPF